MLQLHTLLRWRSLQFGSKWMRTWSADLLWVYGTPILHSVAFRSAKVGLWRYFRGAKGDVASFPNASCGH